MISSASRKIWTFVCGLPEPKRRKRNILILNGYIDDSKDDSVFVLAGFVAPADEWAAFSDAWQGALNMRPRIKLLKTKDAMGRPPSGEFLGITEELRDERMRLFYSIIDKHVSFEVSVVIPMKPFKRIFGNGVLPKDAANPYYFALPMLVADIARHQINIGMKEKIDFIFDEQPKEQAKILSIWEQLVENAPSDVKPMLGGAPTFKNDEEDLPLQAADMEAWWVRQRWKENILNIPRREYPWTPENIGGITCVFTEDILQNMYNTLLQQHRELGIID